MIKIIESPRDAMQGFKQFIPTKDKIEFLNALLKVGFHSLDFGSFVSHKAIPQMADTHEVVSNLDLSESQTKLLAIVANLRGANEAAQYEQIHYIGFPFSISRTFSELNINSNVKEAYRIIDGIQNICAKQNKELVLYMSMAFGNPYGDKWGTDIVYRWTRILQEHDVKIIAFSDTMGLGNKERIYDVFKNMIHEFPHIEFGAHLHTTPSNWEENLDAAYRAGCRRFDSVLNGLGGCPMSQHKLVGNLHTAHLLEYLDGKNETVNIDRKQLQFARDIANRIYPGID
ncbi:MAG: hydroxymethylglutaryl-CoA lyase [Bacteroidetes bacterium]|nr:MAG: hydroxymethylglutaryl-CoA lyase [Bacteroidota bacterium]